MIRTAITYTMRVFWNLVTVAIVLWIFAKLQGHFEVIVVSVLGFIYAAIRFIDLRNFDNSTQAGFAIDEQFLRIRGLLGDETVKDRRDAISKAKEIVDHTRVLRGIDYVFVVMIWLICLYKVLYVE